VARRRRPSTGTILWLALALVVGVLAVLPTRGKKNYPKQWDTRVTDLVAFVEDARGLHFKHPVTFDFFTDAAFDKLVATQRPKPNPERRRTQDAVLRARGYVGPTFDSTAAEEDLVANISGFYSHVDKKMRVRGLELSAEAKLILVHELTHALQDQHFNISHLYSAVDSDEKAFGLRSLIEGDARNIENQYFRSLSTTEQQEIDQIEHPDGQSPQLDSIPEALIVQQGAPYELGALLAITLRHLGGVDRLNQAFHAPPKGEAGVVLPFATPSSSSGDLPAFPSDGTEVSGADTVGQLSTGPLSTFLTLSSRIEPIVAWRAAIGWGSEDLRAMRRGGEVCVDSLVLGKTAEDTERLRAAYEQWAASVAKVTVGELAGAILVQSCDASSAAPEPRTDIFTDLYRLSEADLAFYDEAERAGASAEAASCATLKVNQTLNALEFSQGDLTSRSVPQAAAEAVRQALASCS
jgi:hypothetical protein